MRDETYLILLACTITVLAVYLIARWMLDRADEKIVYACRLYRDAREGLSTAHRQHESRRSSGALRGQKEPIEGEGIPEPTRD